MLFCCRRPSVVRHPRTKLLSESYDSSSVSALSTIPNLFLGSHRGATQQIHLKEIVKVLLVKFESSYSRKKMSDADEQQSKSAPRPPYDVSITSTYWIAGSNPQKVTQRFDKNSVGEVRVGLPEGSKPVKVSVDQ